MSEPTILARLRDLEARITALEAGTATGLSGTDQTIRGSHDRLDSLLGAGNAAPTGDVVTNLNADTVDGIHAAATPTANYLLALDANKKLPASITGDAHTVDGIHAATTATANYLLALNADKKLPASITGDAHTVDGKHASELVGVQIAAYREHSSQEYNTTSTTLADLPGCYKDIDVQAGDIVAVWATFRHAISAARGSAVKYRARIGDTYSVTQEVGNPYNVSYFGAAVALVDTISASGTIRVGAQFAGCSTSQTVYARDMELVVLVIS